jgi:hypothetical protein
MEKHRRKTDNIMGSLTAAQSLFDQSNPFGDAPFETGVAHKDAIPPDFIVEKGDNRSKPTPYGKQ